MIAPSNQAARATLAAGFSLQQSNLSPSCPHELPFDIETPPIGVPALGTMPRSALPALGLSPVRDDDDAIISAVISGDVVIEARFIPSHDDEPAHRHGYGNKPLRQVPRNKPRDDGTNRGLFVIAAIPHLRHPWPHAAGATESRDRRVSRRPDPGRYRPARSLCAGPRAGLSLRAGAVGPRTRSKFSRRARASCAALVVRRSFTEVRRGIDTLLVSGGLGARRAPSDGALVRWLRRIAFLDGRRATTH